MKKLNYVWFCTDQQRIDSIGAYGDAPIQTPNIDRLAREGVLFERAYAQNPTCTPSRASFLTGRYPKSARACVNGNLHFSKDETLVTKLLADAGWTCGLVGKLHLTGSHRRMEERADDGYSFLEWSHHPHDSWPEGINAYQSWLKEKGVCWKDNYISDFEDWPPGKMHHLPDRITGMPARYHQTTWCVDKAIEFMKQSGETPWCVSVNPFDPHPPFDPPREYKDRLKIEDMPLPLWKEGELDAKPPHHLKCHREGNPKGHLPPTAGLTAREHQEIRRDYMAEVLLIDDQLGRLLDYLDETGQRENTVVIFMSDHGEMLGDHGLYWKAGYFYEPLIHVPLIVSCPGVIKQGLRSSALVELVDVAPTILELSGEPVPRYMQGSSLAGILKGESDPSFHKDCVYAEYYYTGGRTYPVSATMYFDGRYKIVVHHNQPVGELYDLLSDPHEFDNLWGVPEYAVLRSELVIKCFNNAMERNVDRVLGVTGMF